MVLNVFWAEFSASALFSWFILLKDIFFIIIIIIIIIICFFRLLTCTCHKTTWLDPLDIPPVSFALFLFPLLISHVLRTVKVVCFNTSSCVSILSITSCSQMVHIGRYLLFCFIKANIYCE